MGILWLGEGFRMNFHSADIHAHTKGHFYITENQKTSGGVSFKGCAYIVRGILAA